MIFETQISNWNISIFSFYNVNILQLKIHLKYAASSYIYKILFQPAHMATGVCQNFAICKWVAYSKRLKNTGIENSLSLQIHIDHIQSYITWLNLTKLFIKHDTRQQIDTVDQIDLYPDITNTQPLIVNYLSHDHFLDFSRVTQLDRV